MRAAIFLLMLAALGNGAVADTAAQRADYARALNLIQQGKLVQAQPLREQLSDYPLSLYLDKAALERSLAKANPDDLEAFLRDQDGTVAAQLLRERWLRLLASRNQWQTFLQHYRDLSSTTLRCQRLEALYQTGGKTQALVETTELWMTSRSLPDACDAPFRRWLAEGQQTQPLIWGRLQLTLDNGNRRLARYLVTRLEGDWRQRGQLLLAVDAAPASLPKQLPNAIDDAHASELAALGIRRLAPQDLPRAMEWLEQPNLGGRLQEPHRSRVQRALAAEYIASGADALPWILRQDPNGHDLYLLEWRIRLALREANWVAVRHWIALLPESEQTEPQWRYWQARATEASGDSAQQALAQTSLSLLASERHYYGFLAANHLGQALQFNDSGLLPTELDLNAWPALRRAEEFYRLGQTQAAWREWHHATNGMDTAQLVAASRLASDWGWHDRAIHTAVAAGGSDDLQVRFPLAYQADFLKAADAVGLAPSLLFAVARQESAFASHVRSPAGALGLMQLMPDTARQVAGNPSLSQANLLQPTANIQLGSRYLASLLKTFSGNRVLAAAAYNAGPHRISRVLERQAQAMPFDVWIETLPYHETREYVKGILSFAAIYDYRLGVAPRFLDASEGQIGLPQGLLAQVTPVQ